MPARQESEPLTRQHMDIAASVQAALEDAVLMMTRGLAAEYGHKNLCMAGGVALNCVANGKILRDGKFDNIWIQPAAGDAGCAVGAALAAHHALCAEERRPNGMTDGMSGAFLGPAFSETNIQQRLLAEKYQHAALVPASPWLMTSPTVAMTAPPLAPLGGQQLGVTLTASASLRWLAIWKRYQAGNNEPQWIFSLQTAGNPVISLADDLPHAQLRQVVVSALDRSGQESPRSSYTLP